jgi:PAS domain S-box-containing protein
VLEDISGRRKAEEQLRAEHEIALVLNSASALDAVLPLCLATAIRLSGMDAGGIYLVNEDTGDLELACSSGLSGEFIRETSRISAGSDSAGLVSAGRPVYSQHRNLGVSLTGTREKEGLRAIAIIPILSKNRVIACFNIASHSREVVPEENRRALETIAGQIGGGIARLRAEEARKTSEEHLRTVMQAVQTGILIIDTATHTIVDANRKALAMIGAAEDEVIGAVCHRFICPFEEGKCPVTDMQQEIDVSERVLVTSRGERVPVLKTVSPAVIQGRPVLVESFIDISELKKKEERIRILAGLLDLIPASVTVHDAEGRFLYANATTFDYHGYSEDEFYKINLHQLDTPETERLLAGRIQEGLKKILMPPFEVGHFRKDRSVLPLLVNAKTMEWEGRPVFLSVATDITERKKMEEALRESETRFRNIVNLAQDGIWAVDPEGITTFVNRRMAEMLGYTAEEMTGSPMQRFMDEKGRGIAARNYPKYRQGIQEQVEFEFVRKDKTRITALVSNTSLFDSSGTFTGALAVVSDITARKKAEDALRESERKYRILIDNANEGIVVAQGGYLKFVNKKTAEISGYSETELLSRPFAGFIHESDREMIASRYDQRTSGKAPPADYEFRLLHKSGSVRWLEIRPVLITWEGSPATLNFISDITERKQAEEAFRLSEEKYRTLVERSQEGVFITQDQRVVFANAAFARMLGYTVDGITGRDIREGIAPGDLERVIDLNRRRLAGEQVPEFYELTMQHCDGKTKIPVSMSVGMIQYQGRPAAMGTLRDITELKQIQEALIQTNKKLAMLSSVTRHDMLNMITAIHGYHELIHVVEDDRKVLELLAKEEAAINAIERQIAFTREYECLGVKAPRWQRVHDVIEKAVSQFDLKGVKVKNSTRGLEVFADAMLEKVFYNLTDNALRYGSTITSISISHKKSGDGRLIAYEDDGIGIPKSEKERIFSKGFGQNTGLGLFLAQEILSITGISIKETGTSGKGACFEILIPKGAYRIKKKD